SWICPGRVAQQFPEAAMRRPAGRAGGDGSVRRIHVAGPGGLGARVPGAAVACLDAALGGGSRQLGVVLCYPHCIQPGVRLGGPESEGVMTTRCTAVSTGVVTGAAAPPQGGA